MCILSLMQGILKEDANLTDLHGAIGVGYWFSKSTTESCYFYVF